MMEIFAFSCQLFSENTPFLLLAVNYFRKTLHTPQAAPIEEFKYFLHATKMLLV